MNILSYNPGHDGAIAVLRDGRLIASIEAEKDSNYRYSPFSVTGVLDAIGEIDEPPDVICVGGWWPRDHHEYVYGSRWNAGYRGVSENNIIVGRRRLFRREATSVLFMRSIPTSILR